MKLNMYKPVGWEDMYSKVLKELVDVVAKSSSIMFEKTCLSAEVTSD